MKIKIILMITLLSVVIGGCSSEKDNSLVEDGKLALEQHNYEKAKEILSDALEQDSTDEYARAMYMQAMIMGNVNEYKKQGNYKKAIAEIELIEGIKNGSSTIKSEVSKQKKELEKLNEEYEQAQQNRKENAKLVYKKDKYRIEQEAKKEQQRQLDKQKEDEKNKEEEEQKQEQEQNKKQEESNKPDNIVVSPPDNIVISPPIEETSPQVP